MARVTPANVDQFMRFASSCPVVVFTRSGNQFSVTALPLDAQITVSQADLDRLRLQLPAMEEVTSVVM